MNDQELGLALRSLRAELSPSGADKLRLRAALGLAAGGAAAAGTLPEVTSSAAAPQAAPPAAASAALTPGAALLASGKLGASLAALLFGMGVAVGLLARGAVPEPLAGVPSVPATATPQALVRALPESALAPPLLGESESAPRVSTHDEPASLPVLPRSPRGRPARPHAELERAATLNPLTEELALLRRVERALRANDPALAVALLRELDQRYPETRLAEERQAARRMADCRRHEPDAVLEARAFLSAHPASVYSERVQLACDLETTEAAAPR